MPVYMYIHPFFGALVVTLILGAFAMKVRARKFYKLHYATGLGAVVAAVVAVGLAVFAAVRYANEVGSLSEVLAVGTFVPHTLLAALALLALLLQVGMGVTMLVSRGTWSKVIPFHRRNARLLVGSALFVSVFGLATVGLALAGP